MMSLDIDMPWCNFGLMFTFNMSYKLVLGLLTESSNIISLIVFDSTETLVTQAMLPQSIAVQYSKMIRVEIMFTI